MKAHPTVPPIDEAAERRLVLDQAAKEATSSLRIGSDVLKTGVANVSKKYMAGCWDEAAKIAEEIEVLIICLEHHQKKLISAIRIAQYFEGK